jgi:hypothetical protein
MSRSAMIRSQPRKNIFKFPKWMDDAETAARKNSFLSWRHVPLFVMWDVAQDSEGSWNSREPATFGVGSELRSFYVSDVGRSKKKTGSLLETPQPASAVALVRVLTCVLVQVRTPVPVASRLSLIK